MWSRKCKQTVVWFATVSELMVFQTFSLDHFYMFVWWSLHNGTRQFLLNLLMAHITSDRLLVRTFDQYQNLVSRFAVSLLCPFFWVAVLAHLASLFFYNIFTQGLGTTALNIASTAIQVCLRWMFSDRSKCQYSEY
jgi:hypothetical protein